jgi:hypothetical protein
MESKEFQSFFVDSLKLLFEEKLSTKFNSKNPKIVDYQKNISDLTFTFNISKDNVIYKINYFLDKKLILNLTKTFINDIDTLDIESDLFLHVINEINSNIVKSKISEKVIIRKKTKEKLESDYIISKSERVLENENKLKLNLFTLSSNKGDISIGFQEDIINEVKNIKSDIFIEKSKKEDFANSMMSTVQLLEVKKNILTSLSEIKDLRGDNEFLLRKSKAIADLSKLWIDILKEEEKS